MAVKVQRALYATVVFTSSYIAAVYINRLAVLLMSVSFGYYPHVHFWGISGWSLSYIEWSRMRVLLIFSSGTIALLFTALLIGILYKDISPKWQLVKFFFLWLFIHCLALVGGNIGGSIIGFEEYNSVYYDNFSVIFNWWGISVALLYATVAVYAVLFLIAGYFFATKLLRFSHSGRLASKHSGRLQLLIQFYVLPAILGMALILPFSFETVFYPTCHLLALTLLLIGMIFRISDYYQLSVYRADIASGRPWVVFLFSVLFLLPVLNK